MKPPSLFVGHRFSRLGGAWALIAPQIHRGNGIGVRLTRSNAVIAERRHAHQLLVQLLGLAAVNAAKDVVSRQIALYVWRPRQIDEWLLSDAREYRLQAARFSRRVNVPSEGLGRFGIATLDRHVHALRVNQSHRGDPVIVFRPPGK